MYTVALVTSDNRKVLGRNRTTLGAAEKLARQRLYDLTSAPDASGAFVAVVLIDNSFTEIERWPVPAPSSKPKHSRGRRHKR